MINFHISELRTFANILRKWDRPCQCLKEKTVEKYLPNIETEEVFPEEKPGKGGSAKTKKPNSFPQKIIVQKPYRIIALCVKP